MNVLGTFVLDASGASEDSYERSLERVEARTPTLAPLRRRMIRMPLGLDQPIRIDDPDRDVRRHVQRLRSPAPGSDRVLADRVARVAAQRLDRARPLWPLWAIEGLTEARVDFALGFGAAVGRLLKIALEQTAESPAAREVAGAADPTSASAGTS
jgi:hypothetical protein